MSIYKLICCLLLFTTLIDGLDVFKQSECGKTKSCLRWSSCDLPNCNFGISWKAIQYNSTNYLQIELVGKLVVSTAGYLALGFSNDRKMINNGVVSCLYDNGGFNITAAYNLNHRNYPLTEDAYDQDFFVKSLGTIYGLEFDSQRNILRCRFLRIIDPILNMDKLKKLSGGVNYFALSATGNVINGKPVYHQVNKRPSIFSYDFQSSNYVDNIIDSPTVLVKLHGCFMIVGWIFLATNGIIMANFYKGNWPAKQLFKGKIWFQLHRMIQSCCVIFVSVGFILIFVNVQGYSSMQGLPNAAHPVMGIVATSLMFTNLIMAFFRCHPEDSKRWIFNRMHLVVGISAYVLAITTIIIGIQLPSAGPNLHNINYPWILVTIFLGFIITLFIYGEIRRKLKQKIYVVNMGMSDNILSERSSENQHKPAGYELIIISGIISFVFGIVSIILVSVN